MFTADKGLI